MRRRLPKLSTMSVQAIRSILLSFICTCAGQSSTIAWLLRTSQPRTRLRKRAARKHFETARTCLALCGGNGPLWARALFLCTIRPTTKLDFSSFTGEV